MGSSRQAIKKYIAANYKVDIVKIGPFLNKALKAGVAKKTLVAVKGSYKLAKVEKPKKKVVKKKAAKKSPKKKVAKKPAAKKAKSPKKAKTAKKAKTPKKAKTAKKAAKPAAKKAAKPAAKKAAKPAKKAAAKKSPKKAKAAPKKKSLFKSDINLMYTIYYASFRTRHMIMLLYKNLQSGSCQVILGMSFSIL